jgi:hypothetical protein
MTESSNLDNKSPKPFESASELRIEYENLLDLLDVQLEKDASIEGEVRAIKQLESEICHFLERGSATGVYSGSWTNEVRSK